MAFRYLRAHKIIYFSIAGVAIGIMTLVGVTSIMGGFARDMKERIRGLQTDMIVTTQENNHWIVNPDGLCDEIAKVAGVTGAAPRIEYDAWLGIRGIRRPVHLLGIVPERERKVSNLARYFAQGDKKTFDFNHEGGEAPREAGVVVGVELQRDRLDRRVGLMTAVDRDTPLFCVKEFEEVGSFRSGMSEYDSTFVVMHLDSAREFLKVADPGRPPRANVIAVALQDYDRDGQRVRDAIVQTVHRFRPCESEHEHRYGRCGPFRTMTWEKVKGNLMAAVEIERGIMIIVLFLIVVVAAFNIAAIYTLVVRAKTRDIGILRALGATEGGVTSVFLMSGGLCGVIGSIFGLTLGLLFAHNVNEIEGFIRVVSRELNKMRLEGNDTLWATFFLDLTAAALVWNWIVFYKVGRRHPWVRMASVLALLMASVWACTTWLGAYRPFERFDPDLGEGFRWKLMAWTGGVWVALVGAWRLLDRYRRRPAWVFFGFAGSLAFGAFLTVIAAAMNIAQWVSIMKPSPGWRGLELFDRRIYYLDRIPVYVDSGSLAIIVVLTLVVSVIFAIYPAMRASAANPIEAIRDE
ncbi:MAG TPA: FtsX-like permease family protein [Planctomycetota bacterium]|nr:FtsX-like permease family protein [Planctomycetota bacterium]